MNVFLELGQRPDEPGPPIGGRRTFSDDVLTRLRRDATAIVAKYPQPRSALLPLLHLMQAEDGYLTSAGIGFCAEFLGLTDAEVTAVATFYSMYRRVPSGEYLVGVCTNTLCAVMGGDAIVETLREHLGIDTGQTTADGRVTLEHVECNAACDYAPVVMVNWQFFDNQTPSSARDLVDALRAGAAPEPSRGWPLCGFRETSKILAGVADSPTDGITGAGDATLAGLRYARDHAMAAPPAGAPNARATETGDTGDAGSATDRGAVAAADAAKDKPAPGPEAHVPVQSSTPETDPGAEDLP